MTFRWLGIYDESWPKVRLFRVVWAGPGRNRVGTPLSHKLSTALRPVLFDWERDTEGWRLAILGLEVHMATSHGGVFAP